MKFGFKRRLVKGAPVDDCGPVRTSQGLVRPYTKEELETIMETERPLTLEETQLAARNRREAAGDRAAMEAWYKAEGAGR
jgi:hypothetical protein